MKCMDNLRNHIFLLGGYDLEMVEIKRLLERQGLTCIDHHLAWGATLSSYQDCFNDEDIFVGIELIADIPLPKKYIEIDHHNEKAGMPSSIEQTAKLLGIELTRWQNLVAANDKGYIKAMKSLKASSHEIEQIRGEDRKAQGITFEEEMIAEEEVKTLFKFVKDVGNIKTSLNSRSFAAITDRLVLNKLLVYNGYQVNYFGESADILGTSIFSKEVMDGSAFFGGGHDGFFGINCNSLGYSYVYTIPVIQ